MRNKPNNDYWYYKPSTKKRSWRGAMTGKLHPVDPIPRRHQRRQLPSHHHHHHRERPARHPRQHQMKMRGKPKALVRSVEGEGVAAIARREPVLWVRAPHPRPHRRHRRPMLERRLPIRTDRPTLGRHLHQHRRHHHMRIGQGTNATTTPMTTARKTTTT